MFRQDCTCPALLEDRIWFTATGLSPALARFPNRFALCHSTTGLVPVRSPLLRESRLMSFPPGTEMFHFPGLALNAYVFSV